MLISYYIHFFPYSIIPIKYATIYVHPYLIAINGLTYQILDFFMCRIKKNRKKTRKIGILLTVTKSLNLLGFTIFLIILNI